ncbi:MAG: DUF4430 domain-containing protein [Candidatus Thorarchaeota archaeon]|jgi:hypothetical protein
MERKSGCMFVLLILIFSTSQLAMHTDAQPAPTSLAIGIDLEIDFGNGTTVLIPNLEGTDVLSVTDEYLELVVEWFGNLAYVTSIDGVANDHQAGLFWQYWINDELAPVAANQMIVNDDDHILWKRTTSNFIEPPPTAETDYGVLIGIIVVGIWGPVFLGMLHVITRWRTDNQ